MSNAGAGAPLLEVRNLSKHFGAVRALDDFSMTVNAGEVVAIAGDNGAGKTTMIKAVSGVFQPTSGEILLRGQPMHFASPQDAREKGIETIYQDLALADNLSEPFCRDQQTRYFAATGRQCDRGIQLSIGKGVDGIGHLRQGPYDSPRDDQHYRARDADGDEP